MAKTNFRDKILNAIKNGEPLIVSGGKLIPQKDLKSNQNQNDSPPVKNQNSNDNDLQVEIKPHDWGI